MFALIRACVSALNDVKNELGLFTVAIPKKFIRLGARDVIGRSHRITQNSLSLQIELLIADVFYKLFMNFNYTTSEKQ